MKIKICILIFCFSGFFCDAQISVPGCASFKTGKFTYTDSGYIVRVKRTNHSQEEYDVSQKVTTKFKVKWISDCEYHLKQVWSDSKAQRKFNGEVHRIVIRNILDSNSYEYDCGCKDPAIKSYKGLMVRNTSKDIYEPY